MGQRLCTPKLPGENLGGALYDIDVAKDFLTRTAFTQELRPKADKYDFTKLKAFCITKETITR